MLVLDYKEGVAKTAIKEGFFCHNKGEARDQKILFVLFFWGGGGLTNGRKWFHRFGPKMAFLPESCKTPVFEAFPRKAGGSLLLKAMLQKGTK